MSKSMFFYYRNDLNEDKLTFCDNNKDNEHENQ